MQDQLLSKISSHLFYDSINSLVQKGERYWKDRLARAVGAFKTQNIGLQNQFLYSTKMNVVIIKYNMSIFSRLTLLFNVGATTDITSDPEKIFWSR